MAEEDRASRSQHRRGRSPPSHSDIPVSDEDRLRLLISKCYDDGILPEKFMHGEWKMEVGVKTFVVNPRLDELTTNWLKERTVTIIFQGAARDLPMKVREDLIRAYENGWYRQRIFDRTTKRGRVHAEGPNVVSYVAKSREVAQWMIAKAKDNIVIRGVEYNMIFKPWLTRTKLEERRRMEDDSKFWVMAIRVPLRRRLEDDSKFWVMAIRVPLRAMFHVESMIETSMGHVINSLPPEHDKTRPKLMNLKFDLGMGYHQQNPALTGHMPQFYNCYGTGQGLNYVVHEVARRELAVDHGGRERQARCRQEEGTSRPRRQEVVHSDEEANSEGIPEAPTSELSGMEASPGRIPEGVDAAGRDGRQFEEQILLPLVCTMQDQKAYVIGLLDRADKLILPTGGLTDIPMQSTVRE
ncbi:hypothetical protein CBR_g20099 [Chara braunii]|uniref:Uncharacterized protein n=1 Tax=Chara braunii TaxID=69332 RepID=A0A388KZI0_CHABU|nr:hypothetical protein CBR_g20099 [Chara braunii]|eukprot:GBG75467.1 hypothetical protein CBR_g20099 [Chara braunii]